MPAAEATALWPWQGSSTCPAARNPPVHPHAREAGAQSVWAQRLTTRPKSRPGRRGGRGASSPTASWARPSPPPPCPTIRSCAAGEPHRRDQQGRLSHLPGAIRQTASVGCHGRWMKEQNQTDTHRQPYPRIYILRSDRIRITIARPMWKARADERQKEGPRGSIERHRSRHATRLQKCGCSWPGTAGCGDWRRGRPHPPQRGANFHGSCSYAHDLSSERGWATRG